MTTSVVVVTYNSARWIRACLEALGQRATIVVDNASTDETVQIVRQEFPSIGLIARSRNGGYAVAVNEGASAAGRDDVLVLNPDVIVNVGAIEVLEAYLAAKPSVGVAAPRLIYPDGTIQESARTFPSPLKQLARRSPLGLMPWGRRLRASYLMTDNADTEPHPVDFVIGAAMLVRRAAIDDVGGMDERIFLYAEDVDWCYRMWARGWQVHFLPTASFEHHYERHSKRSLDLRSAAVRHHWASLAKLYAIHPRLLFGKAPQPRKDSPPN